MTESEPEAVARLQQGDIGGLETLVRQYYPRALKASFLISHNQALAEDTVQAAFLRAYERIAQFDGQRPFGPWFLRSVVNDTLAALTRHPQLSIGTAQSMALDQYPDPALDPAALLAAAETKAAVWAAIEQLTPEQRAVIVARYYLDLRGYRLAHHLAVPSGTVRRRLYEARRRLQAILPTWVWQETGD